MKAKLNFNALNNLQVIRIGSTEHYCLEHPRYLGYYISNQGEVISCVCGYTGKASQARGSSKPKSRRHQMNNAGYLRLLMSLPTGGGKHELVHRLVAETFLEPPSAAPDLKDPIGADKKPRIEINHIDGNKCNNSVFNLEWCSHQENIHHQKVLNSVAEELKAYRSLKKDRRS
jgi:hypothetical protein